MKKSKELSANDIKEELKVFMTEHFLLEVNPNPLSDEDSFLEKGVVDSTGILEIVSFIETNFQIKVADEELLPDNLDSINKLTAFVKTKLSVGS